jgi:hypothetical protein
VGSINFFLFIYFDLDIRYKNERMLQICVMPGDRAPKSQGFWSYLQPLIDEIKVLSSRGMDVICDDGIKVHSKVRLLVATGDIVAVSALANHSGHVSKSGCRICPITGCHNANRHGMYFPPTQENLSLPWRTHESYLEGDKKVL